LIKAVIIAMLMLPSNKVNFLFNILLNFNIRNYSELKVLLRMIIE
jgi:hypothetical protein